MTRYTAQKCAEYIKTETGLVIEVSLVELQTKEVKLEVLYDLTRVIEQPAPDSLKDICLPPFFHCNEYTLPFRIRLIQLLIHPALRREILDQFEISPQDKEGTSETSIIQLEAIRLEIRTCTALILGALEGEENVMQLLSFMDNQR